MTAIRRVYAWLHVLFRGHYPPGMLVMLSNRPLVRGILPESHLLPGDIGISLGKWERWQNPGFLNSGTRVLVGGGVYNIENFDLMPARRPKQP